MKLSLIKLLLALSLVVNPVAVLAVDFHDVSVQADQTMEEAHSHPSDRDENPSEPTDHDSTNCEMPCCEDSDCLAQGTCVFQYSSAVLAQSTVKVKLSTSPRDWDALVSAVPDRELPPENPPPIRV